MRINVQFDTKTTNAKIQAKVKKCQMVLDAQALKDSNYYCPLDTGMLQKSGITNTVIGKGQLVWNTPYAKEQYYGKPNKSHQRNPNATMKWFEVAKSKNIKNWEKLVNDEYNKNN